MNVEKNKYPLFWLSIRPGFSKSRINPRLKCPMNNVFRVKFPSYNPKTTTLPITDFIVNYENQDIAGGISSRIEELITKYSLQLYDYRKNFGEDPIEADFMDEPDYLLLRADFDDLIAEIRMAGLPLKYLPLMSYLINRTFVNKGDSKLNKNRSLLLRILYEVNPKAFLMCFSKHLNSVNIKQSESKENTEEK